MSDSASFDAFTPRQMCERALTIMEANAVRPAREAFPLAILAGVLIGMGFVYCALVNVVGGGRVLGGLVFSIGLQMVVALGAALFTATSMTLIPRAEGRVTWGQVLSNWAVVYAGNFLGCLLLVGIVLLSGHPWENGGAIARFCIDTTAHKLSHTFVEAVFLGVLCNMMVCLGVWMSYGGRSLFDRIVVCIMPVGLFIACGFEHSIANMYMLPLGILCSRLAPPELLAQLPDPAHVAATLTWPNFLLRNLLPVTLGNILGGGVLVGLSHWYIHLRKR